MALFDDARFEVPVSFDDVHFEGLTSFNDAHFEGLALFDDAHFEGSAWFKNVHFEGPAEFGYTHFERPAHLDNARCHWDRDQSEDIWPDGWTTRGPESDDDGHIEGREDVWGYVVQVHQEEKPSGEDRNVELYEE